MEALSVSAAARYLGIGRVTLYNLIKTNTGPASLKIGKRRLFRRDALDQWMKVQERREMVNRAQREIAAEESAASHKKDAA